MLTSANAKTDLDDFFVWSKYDSSCLNKQLEVFKQNDNKEFRQVQNLTVGDFNKIMRLRNLLAIAAENIAREENLSTVLIPTLSKNKDEHFKLANKVVDVVDRENRKVCVTLLRYGVDKPKYSYAQVGFPARNMEDENFQHILYVSYRLEILSFCLM